MNSPLRRRLREGGDTVTFDFAPMVDVVLLLLIFFFLTSSLGVRQQALPLDLPRASSAVQESPALPIVSVDQGGKVFLNGKATTLSALERQLKPLLVTSKGVVGLRADERGNYGQVVQVMDVIKRAGGERLALGTRPATPAAP